MCQLFKADDICFEGFYDMSICVRFYSVFRNTFRNWWEFGIDFVVMYRIIRTNEIWLMRSGIVRLAKMKMQPFNYNWNTFGSNLIVVNVIFSEKTNYFIHTSKTVTLKSTLNTVSFCDISFATCFFFLSYFVRFSFTLIWLLVGFVFGLILNKFIN